MAPLTLSEKSRIDSLLAANIPPGDVQSITGYGIRTIQLAAQRLLDRGIIQKPEKPRRLRMRAASQIGRHGLNLNAI